MWLAEMFNACVAASTPEGTPARPREEQSTVILEERHKHSHLRGQAALAALKSSDAESTAKRAIFEAVENVLLSSHSWKKRKLKVPPSSSIKTLREKRFKGTFTYSTVNSR